MKMTSQDISPIQNRTTLDWQLAPANIIPAARDLTFGRHDLTIQYDMT